MNKQTSLWALGGLAIATFMYSCSSAPTSKWNGKIPDLKNIHSGMTRQEVKGLLNEPDSIGTSKREWYYGTPYNYVLFEQEGDKVQAVVHDFTGGKDVSLNSMFKVDTLSYSTDAAAIPVNQPLQLMKNDSIGDVFAHAQVRVIEEGGGNKSIHIESDGGKCSMAFTIYPATHKCTGGVSLDGSKWGGSGHQIIKARPESQFVMAIAQDKLYIDFSFTSALEMASREKFSFHLAGVIPVHLDNK